MGLAYEIATNIKECMEGLTEGFTDSVAKEVKPEWNIKFTCIEPGGFR